ncbi:hypothetical protein ACVD4U_004317 [Vibrio vulnificus]|uniref:hypothetical protein n=1 Tax=Vibrio vulnificus TaxID=672 RepID=UPI0006AD312C|nr:hypothetical protein [Vibrio vulnificus]KOR94648.1 hypothetical protein LO82_21900 [Vibrio vulnificus]HDY8067495.1 hypothetical protein [Vibrio vulnificus]
MIEKDNSQNELESLVEMAESVSATIEDLNTKIVNLRTMAMISMVGVYATVTAGFFLFENSLFIEKMELWAFLLMCMFTLTLLIGSGFFLFQYFRKIKSLKYKLDTEKEVLEHLLPLVFEYKDNIYSNDSSYVEKALIEMRLKRIGFSTRW